MIRGSLILPVLLMVMAFSMPAKAQEALPLDEAYARVLAHNPQVRSYKAMIDAAEGNRIQQALRPNPEAVFEVEDFAGDRPRGGFGAAEYTLGVEQQIEIAGKRGGRERVASYEKEQARQESLAAIQAILAETKAAYMSAAIAQEHVALAQKRKALADKTHTAVKARIEAAKSADIEHTKADIEVSAAEVELRKAERELAVARTALANLMGQAVLDADVQADLKTLPALPNYDQLMKSLETTPMQVMSKAMVMREQAALDLARANGVPDPTVGLGMRRYSEDDGSAFLASLSIPIPIADRNQGRVAQAKAQLRSAQAGQEAQRLNLTKRAQELWQTLQGTRDEVLAYQDGILPSAQRAYTQAEDGFDRGAFTFLDMLDAQRTLFDVQEQYLQALSSFYETQAQIDMLTGAYNQAALTALNTHEKE